MNEHLFWIASRAAGISALLLASAAVALGLMTATRRVPAGWGDLRPIHEALSLATMAAIVIHAGLLLGDGFLRPTVADLTIPFVSSYKTVWTSLGIISGWALIVLGLSYYARAHIGVTRWRKLHRFSALAWLAALGHSLGEGTDAGTVWFLAAVTIAILPAVVLLVLRAGDDAPTPEVVR